MRAETPPLPPAAPPPPRPSRSLFALVGFVLRTFSILPLLWAPRQITLALTHQSRVRVQQLGVTWTPRGLPASDDASRRARSLIVICHDRLASGFVFIKAEPPGSPPPPLPFLLRSELFGLPTLSPRMHYSFRVISTNGSLIFRLSRPTFFPLPPTSSEAPFHLVTSCCQNYASQRRSNSLPLAVHHLLLASLLLSPPLTLPLNYTGQRLLPDAGHSRVYIGAPAGHFLFSPL